MEDMPNELAHATGESDATEAVVMAIVRLLVTLAILAFAASVVPEFA